MAEERIEHEIPEMRVLPNRQRRNETPGGAPDRAPLEFHRRLPGYGATPLIEAPEIASALGVGQVWVKNEAERLGLPAFKVLGASWATYRALLDQLGIDASTHMNLDELRDRLAPARPLTLAAATDGNHGRAVARMARWLDLEAEIFVPSDMVPARRAGIASEGATVTVINGSYDDAVARAAREGGERCLVIADIAQRPDEDIPRWVIDGYSTILWEVDDELERLGEPGPDLVAMQIGVGAFAAAVTRHYCRPEVDPRPFLVGIEPLDAACVFHSIQAGEPVNVPGPHRSIMAGLNCGTPSPVAWPVLQSGVDLFLAVDDEWARRAMRLLAGSGIVAGESGAAGLAGLLAWRDGTPVDTNSDTLRLDPSTRILIFNTEGATDPDAYTKIIENH
ncbi:diaminopropionate ammonia-lyase [soil metagenome]